MIKALQQQIADLTKIIFNQNDRINALETEIQGLRKAGGFRASAASYQMNARRVEKRYQH